MMRAINAVLEPCRVPVLIELVVDVLEVDVLDGASITVPETVRVEGEYGVRPVETVADAVESRVADAVKIRVAIVDSWLAELDAVVTLVGFRVGSMLYKRPRSYGTL